MSQQRDVDLLVGEDGAGLRERVGLDREVL